MNWRDLFRRPESEHEHEQHAEIEQQTVVHDRTLVRVKRVLDEMERIEDIAAGRRPDNP